MASYFSLRTRSEGENGWGDGSNMEEGGSWCKGRQSGS